MGTKKKQKEIIVQETKKKVYPDTETVLRLLAAGTVLSTLFISPHLTIGIGVLAKYLPWAEFRRAFLRRTVERLKKRRLVKYIEKGDEIFIVLTEEGREELIHFDLANMSITKPEKWDGKWWQVIFDIPNKRKKSRDIFRRKLKDLGFYFIQESVALYPYPCKKEIEYLREVYGVHEGVNLMRVDYFEDEHLVKEEFGLS